MTAVTEAERVCKFCSSENLIRVELSNAEQVNESEFYNEYELECIEDDQLPFNTAMICLSCMDIQND